MAEKPALLVTCEHGTPFVPRSYSSLFEGRRGILATHRAFDRGSLELARRAARLSGAKLFAGRVTRLLVDLNRSPASNRLFSPFSRRLSPAEKKRLMRRYYEPYRESVITVIRRHLAGAELVVHVSVHTFAPVVRGRRRPADVGLLYDPARPREKVFCRLWQSELLNALPGLRVRRNYPYLGTSDGLTSTLRTHFRSELYAGIELEVNQRFYASSAAARRVRLEREIVATLARSLGRQPLSASTR